MAGWGSWILAKFLSSVFMERDGLPVNKHVKKA